MSKKYVKKPVVIEAVRFEDNTEFKLAGFWNGTSSQRKRSGELMAKKKKRVRAVGAADMEIHVGKNHIEVVGHAENDNVCAAERKPKY